MPKMSTDHIKVREPALGAVAVVVVCAICAMWVFGPRPDGTKDNRQPAERTSLESLVLARLFLGEYFEIVTQDNLQMDQESVALSYRGERVFQAAESFLSIDQEAGQLEVSMQEGQINLPVFLPALNVTEMGVFESFQGVAGLFDDMGYAKIGMTLSKVRQEGLGTFSVALNLRMDANIFMNWAPVSWMTLPMHEMYIEDVSLHWSPMGLTPEGHESVLKTLMGWHEQAPNRGVWQNIHNQVAQKKSVSIQSRIQKPVRLEDFRLIVEAIPSHLIYPLGLDKNFLNDNEAALK